MKIDIVYDISEEGKQTKVVKGRNEPAKMRRVTVHVRE